MTTLEKPLGSFFGPFFGGGGGGGCVLFLA